MIERDNKYLSIRYQCNLLDLPRSGIYCEKKATDPEDKKLMDILDEIFLEFPCYGSRRLMRELNRRGCKAGRTKVRRLMRKAGIEAIYPRKKLSVPNRDHTVYPYLLRGLKIDRPNKVWAADITYIPMRKGYMYLVAIIDHYSRFILSWKLCNSLDVDFCKEALNEAIRKYGSPEYFNTDQGSQFTSKEFTGILKKHGVKISMDGKGRASDNIFIERFWRTLKYEEVYIKSYLNVVDCRSNLNEFFYKYNHRRIHQGLNYDIPFERYSELKLAG